ncbi:zinc-ribbon domain-containing protein [Blastopirellula sp. JC732]|uniref:Zinc-ribbon domain-containing protein n=1 Tax=Blastopirellula sediminis TaxID=2894196 RepID=A0A9X1MPI5_9BACT|nr:zinc-ribbon domain-containing protein [Blastopirellula sediminis]MCC9606641.1 zinc-ribbon domain-containing protein [Blastopirellula sediminis]MCC9630062.1 zinc-ribbon domain-containing protein [Blastopirellula sediminis]
MPIEFSCGQCSAKFRVPDVLAGKKVRCPKCQSAERVPTPTPAPEARAQGDDDFWSQKPGQSSSKSLGDVLGAASTSPSASAPTAKRKEKAESLNPSEVRYRISTPATVLFVFAILVTALNAVGVVLWTLQLMFAPPANMNIYSIMFSMFMGAISVCLTAATLKGVNSFRNVDELSWAWTGLVLAMTPFGTSICCVFTIPFAIWGIVLLSDKRISAHFRA